MTKNSKLNCRVERNNNYQLASLKSIDDVMKYNAGQFTSKITIEKAIFQQLRFEVDKANNPNYIVELKSLLSLFENNLVDKLISPDAIQYNFLLFDSKEHKALYTSDYLGIKDYQYSRIMAACFNDCIARHKNIFKKIDTDTSEVNAFNLFKQHADWVQRGMVKFHQIYLSELLKNNYLFSDSCTSKSIEYFVYDLCLKISRELKQDYTRLILDNNDKQLFAELIPINKGESQCILIVTFESGGCHKALATRLWQQLKLTRETTAIINESALYEEDVLKKFFGISFSKLYTEIQQKLNMPELKVVFQKLNEYLLLFISDHRSIIFKKALKYIEVQTETQINKLYLTYHGNHVLKYMLSPVVAYLQLCDFRTIHPVIVNLLKSSMVIADECNLKCLSASPQSDYQDSLANAIHPKTMYYIRYPVSTLEEDEYISLLNLTCKEYMLDTNPKTQRIVITFGAFGGESKLEFIFNKLIKDSLAVTLNRKFEIIFVCGHNHRLQNYLLGKLKSAYLPEELQIKILGFLENKQLIALAKSGVLLTKPGAGSVAEALLNHIPTILLPDPNAFWEQGNIQEMLSSSFGILFDSKINIFSQFVAANQLKNRANGNEKKYPLTTVLSLMRASWSSIHQPNVPRPSAKMLKNQKEKIQRRMN